MTIPSKNPKTALQIVTLLSIMLLFTLLALIPMFLFNRPGVNQWRLLMAMTVIQNVGIFIIPAFVTARIFNNGKTMETLRLNTAPRCAHIGMMLLIYAASIPMMNAIIAWNEGMKLPEAMSGIEQWMRSREDAAALATEEMLNIKTAGQLIVAIFSVGILTGMGEELIFRGSLQRLMTERGINIHVAIWTTAILFSAIHLQFYGFVPRLLLGAYFGYLAIWSGCLWLPIMAHALNNSIAVAAYYNTELESMPWIGENPTVAATIVSTAVTCGLLFIYLRYMKTKEA